MTLYLDTETFDVYLERREGQYGLESFTPTLDLEEGFLVVAVTSTYDSYGPNEGLRYEVLDMYPTFEDAEKVANDIQERRKAKTWRGQKPNPPLFYANGEPYRYYSWEGWGNSLEEILIIEAQPKRRKKVTKISTW